MDYKIFQTPEVVILSIRRVHFRANDDIHTGTALRQGRAAAEALKSYWDGNVEAVAVVVSISGADREEKLQDGRKRLAYNLARHISHINASTKDFSFECAFAYFTGDMAKGYINSGTCDKVGGWNLGDYIPSFREFDNLVISFTEPVQCPNAA